jgi:5-(carboxyamino)imidazole ribonucleotide mutase
VTVAVVMGSDSDWPTMRPAVEALARFDIAHAVRVVSAHRDARDMVEFAIEAERAGVEVVIAGAGGAAHLPGMIASLTARPVIGVPVPVSSLAGLDSLLSIVQMPAGVPVATVAIGAAENAALLAARILAVGDDRLLDRLHQHQQHLREQVQERNRSLAQRLAETNDPRRASG